MSFALILLGTIVFTFLCKSAIKKYPWLFYLIAIILGLLFVWNNYLPFPKIIANLIFLLIQKCTLSLAFFVVVMYIGVFPEGSKVRTWLMPIRAELSIMACFLAFGHVVIYLTSYIPRVIGGSSLASSTILVSLFIAIVLLALLVLLGITSFNFVKKRLNIKTWKRIQLLAYPFFILIYIHLLLLLLPAALRGGTTAIISVLVYSITFMGYMVARLARAALDRKAAKGLEPKD